MKLRIKDNSLRLRLNQSEVRQLSEGEEIGHTLNFGIGQNLRYRLKTTKTIPKTAATFLHSELTIEMNFSRVSDWIRSEESSLYEELKLDNNKCLKILVEKDFQCLKPRQILQEDESDLFVHPGQTHGLCGMK